MATIGALIWKLGLDVSELTENVRTVNTKMDGLAAGAKKVGGLLAKAFVIGGVASAVHEFTQLTGTLTDMSQKTGIGVEALQRLKFAAEQNGTSIDQVTGAITKMGDRLVSGDKSAIGALKTLGLSFADVKRMEPDKAFTTIADAIAKIPNPMERSKLAMDVFGRSGADLLPMMIGNLTELAAQADRLGIVLDESTVKAGDEFGDMMGVLKAQGMALIADVLRPFLPLLINLAKALAWLAQIIGSVVRTALDWFIKATMHLAIVIDEFLAKVADAAQRIPLLGKHLGFAGTAAAYFREDARKTREELAKMGSRAESTGTSVAGLAPAFRETGRASGEAAKKLAAFTKTLADFSGLSAVEKAREYMAILDALTARGLPLAVAKQEEFAKVVYEGVQAAQALGIVMPAAMRAIALMSEEATARVRELVLAAQQAAGVGLDMLRETVREGLEFPQRIGQWVSDLSLDVKFIDPAQLIERLKPALKSGFAEVAAVVAPSFWSGIFAGLKGLGGTLTATIIGAFQGGGNVGQAVGGLLGGNILGGIGSGISAAMKGIGGFGPKLLGFLGGALGPLGSLLGGWVGGLFGKLFGGEARKTRKMRDEWLAQAGGLEKVREMAEYAGVAIDKLLSTKKTKEFQAEVEKLQRAFAETQARVQALTTDLDALAASGEMITAGLAERVLKDIDKPEVQAAWRAFQDKARESGLAALEALASSTAPLTKAAASQLGPAAAAFFQQLRAQGLSLREALAKIPIEAIAKKLGEMGKGGGAAFDRIRAMARLANDEIAGPLLDSGEQAITLMTALANTGDLSAETFKGLASQVSFVRDELLKQGKDSSLIFELQQSQLQQIWEIQQRTGYQLDANTQKLIDEAVASGKVGEQFMSAGERTAKALERTNELLEAIAVAMGATIPAAANEMANGVTEAINRIPRSVDIELRMEGKYPERGEPVSHAYGTGGIAWTPQVASLAESGPEAIIPLDQLRGGGGHVSVTVQLLGGVGLTEDQVRSLETQGTRIGKAVARAAWRDEDGLRSTLQHALGVA